ncbi:unnamed protein product [Thelazia callipaeda]|uniref:Uncharacterized protein n=1 Tax=Thelazia callipaeda TaxID=103827 RepID=A0A0N5CPY8_THECL|nr:unnamed protein product [Thelazia callipaeda]
MFWLLLMSYLYNSLLMDDRNVQQQRPYSTPGALMSQDRKENDEHSSYPHYPSKTDSGLYPVTNTVTVKCSPSTAGNPYSSVDHTGETLADIERLANIERTIEAVSKAEQFNDNSYHQNGDDSTNIDVKPGTSCPPIVGSKRRQFVGKKVRAISIRNPRLGLVVQKKISDCVFEASMELLEIDVSLLIWILLLRIILQGNHSSVFKYHEENSHPEVTQNNHMNYSVN